MVQSSDLRCRDYTSLVAALNRSRFRSVFAERQMGTASMVVFDEHPEPATQISLTEYDHVVEAFASNRSNDPFDVCPLPWRARSRQYLLDAHGFDLLDELTTEDAVAVSEHIAGFAVPRECLSELLNRPLGCGMQGQAHVYNRRRSCASTIKT